MPDTELLKRNVRRIFEGIQHSDGASILHIPCGPLDVEKIASELEFEFKEQGADWSLFEPLTKQLVLEYSSVGGSESDKTLELCKILDTVLALARNGKCDHGLCHSLLEDLFEAHTIQWTQAFWPYVISRESQLTNNLTGTRSPGIIVIRLCNSLVKRLSKNHDGQFSGQVAMFLARAFPLSEKSGVNIRGTFDLENDTVYDMESESNDYLRFWQLQKYFKEPTLLFDAGQMAQFKACVDSLLTLLQQSGSGNGGVKQRRNQRQGGGPRTAANPEAISRLSSLTPGPNDGETEGENNSNVFVPKWMTWPKLFALQLTDPGFREAVVMQLLIIVAFLLDLQPSVKSQWETEQTATNRSVMYNYTLSPSDETYFRSIDKKARNMLSLSFSHTANVVIQRDQGWQMWKLKNCPKLEKDSVDLAMYQDASVKLANEIGKPRNKYWHSMGTSALSRAWKTPTGLERFSENQNLEEIPPPEKFLSKLETLLQQNEDNDSLEFVGQDQDERNERISAAIWQGLRASRDRGDWAKISQEYEYLFLPPKVETDSAENKENDDDLPCNQSEDSRDDDQPADHDSMDENSQKSEEESPEKSNNDEIEGNSAEKADAIPQVPEQETGNKMEVDEPESNQDESIEDKSEQSDLIRDSSEPVPQPDLVSEEQDGPRVKRRRNSRNK